MGEATGGGYLPIGDDAFVVRNSRRSYAVVGVALAGLITGSFFVLGWMFAAGTLILSLAFAGLVYGVTRMNSDSGGVQLAVDREGIYLGRQHPLRLEWARIAEVVTFLGDSHDSEGERWVPYLVVRVTPGESDSLDPLDWGPSCRPDLAGNWARSGRPFAITPRIYRCATSVSCPTATGASDVASGRARGYHR